MRVQSYAKDSENINWRGFGRVCPRHFPAFPYQFKQGEEAMTKDMVLFESSDGKLTLPVQMDGNTVWLSQKQMALLFGKDVSVVNRHIKNAISEGEIEFSSQYAKNANCGGKRPLDRRILSFIVLMSLFQLAIEFTPPPVAWSFGVGQQVC